MLYLENLNGFAPWAGEPINGLRHPPNIDQLWSPDDLAAIGLHDPAPAASLLSGKRVVSTTVQRVNGVVQFVHELEDTPPPTQDEAYPPLMPWRFWAIINMPGSIGEANLRAVINAHPDAAFKAVANAKLNNPPGGFYHRSDALFSNQALIGGLGLTSADIDNLWLAAHAIPG